jgi:hypothetical protein
MSRISRYRRDYPSAYQSLSTQLQQGNFLKTTAIKILIELGGIGFLSKAPVIGQILRTSEGLLAGHIADAQVLEASAALKTQDITSYVEKLLPKILEVDVLIVGSGPGAAVAAEIEIKSSKKSVCVLERGAPPRTPSELHHSLTHVINDFFQGGQELVVASGLPLYAQGSVIGGGSEVNSGLFHNLPELYREDWSKSFGISVEEWLKSEFLTAGQLAPEAMKVSPSDSLLARGAENDNLVCENIPRWRSYQRDGSYIHRGMNLIFWNTKEARERITFFQNSDAIKVDTSNQSFVEVTVKNSKSGLTSKIRAQRVHIAGGAISTPNLLAKSGLIRWRDTKFSWHPMIRIVAKSRRSDLGAGDIDPFQAWTPDRSLKFGSAVSTAPLLSVALGRLVSLEEAAGLRSYYVSFSSSGRGGILPILGLPWYLFSKKDFSLAKQGLETLTKVISQGGGVIVNPEKVNAQKFSTVHIFGTLPISSGVFVAGTNQLKSDQRIRVSDASILPFGPGVNPQGVVMSSVRIANRDLEIS